jgi:acyl-CoA oxidase
MACRLSELQEQHKWSAHEFTLAVVLTDESFPINMHIIGECSLASSLRLADPLIISAFEPVFRLQGSPFLIEKYGGLIANRGILGCYLQTVPCFVVGGV